MNIFGGRITKRYQRKRITKRVHISWRGFFDKLKLHIKLPFGRKWERDL